MQKERTAELKLDVRPLQPLAVSIRDAATLLGLGRNSVYNLLNANILPSTWLGGRRVIKVADLEKLLDEQQP